MPKRKKFKNNSNVSRLRQKYPTLSRITAKVEIVIQGSTKYKQHFAKIIFNVEWRFKVNAVEQVRSRLKYILPTLAVLFYSCVKVAFNSRQGCTKYLPRLNQLRLIDFVQVRTEYNFIRKINQIIGLFSMLNRTSGQGWVLARLTQILSKFTRRKCNMMCTRDRATIVFFPPFSSFKVSVIVTVIVQ